MSVVRLKDATPKSHRVVRTLGRQLEELDTDCRFQLRIGNVRKAIDLSREWMKLARWGGFIR